MLKRIITGAVALPIFIFTVYVGGLVLQITLMAIGLIGLFEFYKSVSQKSLAIHFIGYIFTVLYYLLLILMNDSSSMFIFFTAFILAVHSCLIILYKRVTLMECFVTLYGFFYVPFLLSFIYLIREHELGIYFVWLIFTASFGSDTFAYFIGIKFGKHKLTGTPSPGKSVEGTIGGILGAGLVGFLYGLFITYILRVDSPFMIINATVISLVGAVFSFFGDMSASAIKRYTGIKDFGKVMPGHGGILDRADSVIIAAPIVYMAMKGLMWVIEWKIG